MNLVYIAFIAGFALGMAFVFALAMRDRGRF